MKANPAKNAVVFTILALIISLISCSPKCLVRGRVVDAETRKPIEGAAVAIRWYSDNSTPQTNKTGTIAAVQALSNDNGEFKIPEYPKRQHILGIYKSGYICWSSKDIFWANSGKDTKLKYRQRQRHRIKDGMEVELIPLKNMHSRDLHAGFTVMVAGESTDSEAGPFHQAIQGEYRLWRENMRKDFEKQVGAK